MRRRSLSLILTMSLVLPSLASAATPASDMAQRIQNRLNQRMAGSSSSSSVRPTRQRHANPASRYGDNGATSSKSTVRDRVLKRMFDSVSGRSSSSASSVSDATLARQVLELVNKEREAVGLPPLVRNSLLERSAVKYAEVMREKDYFAHTGPDGRAPTDRIKAEGYPKIADCSCRRETYYGENIARGQTTAEEVMEDWMDSPGHKANILSKDYRELGVGISGNYWVQNFGGVWDNRK